MPCRSDQQHNDQEPPLANHRLALYGLCTRGIPSTTWRANRWLALLGTFAGNRKLQVRHHLGFVGVRLQLQPRFLMLRDGFVQEM